MQRFLIAILLLLTARSVGQPSHYTTSNAHSHNDYEQAVPFYAAYNAGFGSIEADIFLIKGQLIVAHDLAELKKNRSLEDYYIKPLLDSVKKNKGYPYADHHKKLQMMIDIKSGAVNTLDSLVALLKNYPLLINSKAIQWVISGNRPPDSTFASYPAFIWFDGILSMDYSDAALKKIVMMSDDFENYSNWKGEGEMPAADLEKLKFFTQKAHYNKKTVRYWDAPDNPVAWRMFMQVGVDYINTDKIEELSNFLRQQ